MLILPLQLIEATWWWCEGHLGKPEAVALSSFLPARCGQPATSWPACLWLWPHLVGTGRTQTGPNGPTHSLAYLFVKTMTQYWVSCERDASIPERRRRSCFVTRFCWSVCFPACWPPPPPAPSDGKWWHHRQSMSATGPQALPGWYWKHTSAWRRLIQWRCRWQRADGTGHEMRARWEGA